MAARSKVFEFGPYRLDVRNYVLSRGAEVITLPPKTLDLLVALVEAGGSVLSKEELFQRLWPDTVVEEASLTQQVFLLRKALGGATEEYIQTVPRRGYRFVAPVRAVAEENVGARQGQGSRRYWASSAAVAAAVLIVAGIVLWVVPRFSSGDAGRPAASGLSPNRLSTEHYLKGRYFWNRRTEQGYTQAIVEFQQALDADPKFARAWAGLADSYALLGSMANREIPRREAMPKAREAAMRAIELDPQLAEAHTSLAFVKMHYDWDWAGAEQEFRRAMELDPNYPTAHHWYAYYLLAMGKTGEALEQVKRARELDSVSLILTTDCAELAYYAGATGEAESYARKALEMDANFALAHRALGLAYLAEGRRVEAIQELRRAVELTNGSMPRQAELASLEAESGDKQTAEQFLATIASQPAAPDRGLLRALVESSLGQHDAALRSLERAVGERRGAHPAEGGPGVGQLPARPAIPPDRARSRTGAVAQNPSATNLSTLSSRGASPFSIFSAYLAMISASRLTGSPGLSDLRLVASKVWGMMATVSLVPSIWATVRLMPSMEIEPLKTTYLARSAGISMYSQ